MGSYERLLRPLLFRAGGGDPERVHEQTLAALAGLGRLPPARRAAGGWWARHRQPVEVAGIEFRGLVGLAAGMDKDGRAVAAWSSLGFGHVELGTVTARPQPGNDRPRLFRLPSSTALVNRMGFNNAGAQALADRLAAAGVRRGNEAVGLRVGISIGKTKTTPLEHAVEDYLTSFSLLAPYADYLAVNVSSPNTPGLRSLQDAPALRELTAALVGAALRQAQGADREEPAAPRPAQGARAVPHTGPEPVEGPLPIFVKIAPDLDEPALEQVIEVCLDTGVRGLIATNTTVSRDGLAYADLDRAREAGGLSGGPLADRSRAVVRFLRRHTDLPVIGVGGILTATDGRALLDAGADLLQVYTGFVYRGPRLIRDLNRLPTERRMESECAHRMPTD